MFHLMSGLALLLASVMAGALWDAFGHRATFGAGAVFAAVALLGMAVSGRRGRRRRGR
jgi:predicted MFS family arabinose efflux permease